MMRSIAPLSGYGRPTLSPKTIRDRTPDPTARPQARPGCHCSLFYRKRLPSYAED